MGFPFPSLVVFELGNVMGLQISMNWDLGLCLFLGRMVLRSRFGWVLLGSSCCDAQVSEIF